MDKPEQGCFCVKCGDQTCTLSMYDRSGVCSKCHKLQMLKNHYLRYKEKRDGRVTQNQWTSEKKQRELLIVQQYQQDYKSSKNDSIDVLHRSGASIEEIPSSMIKTLA
jgi:hypothetical protein